MGIWGPMGIWGLMGIWSPGGIVGLPMNPWKGLWGLDRIGDCSIACIIDMNSWKLIPGDGLGVCPKYPWGIPVTPPGGIPCGGIPTGGSLLDIPSSGRIGCIVII
mgnify:CR=1 FL=1